MKYYIYISDAKLEMLYAQIPTRIRDRIATELKIDLKLISATFSEKNRLESRYSRLDLVCEYIRGHLPIGTVGEPDAYFEGVIPMQWGALMGADTGSTVFFGGQQGDVVLGLTGSKHHVVGFQGEGMMGYGRSGMVQQVYEDLDRQLADAIQNSESSGGDFRERVHQDEQGLWKVKYVAENLLGPTQRLEFLAKRLLKGQVSDGVGQERTVLLGTPIYVALAD
jgi:hypothetical protein